jgi:uncharacterized protein (UPF0333 family)
MRLLLPAIVLAIAIASLAFSAAGCTTTQRVVHKTGEVTKKAVHKTGGAVRKTGEGVGRVGRGIERRME